jgi:hypothetical protein
MPCCRQVEPLNEYLSAISAHSSYFGSLDIALLIARIVHDRLDFQAIG